MKALFDKTINTNKSPSKDSKGLKLNAAVRNGDLAEFSLLVIDPEINKVYRGTALQAATSLNHIEMARLLLADTSIDAVYKKSALNIAVEKKHREILELLLLDEGISEKDKRFARNTINYDVLHPRRFMFTQEESNQNFLLAIEKRNLNYIQNNRMVSKEIISLAFYEAAEKGDEELVSCLINHPYLSQENRNSARQIAQINKHQMTVFIIDEKITPFSAKKTSVFLAAIEEGNIDDIEKLIIDPNLPNIIKKLGLEITSDRIKNLQVIPPFRPVPRHAYSCHFERFFENEPLNPNNSEIALYEEIFTLIHNNLMGIPKESTELTADSMFGIK